MLRNQDNSDGIMRDLGIANATLKVSLAMSSQATLARTYDEAAGRKYGKVASTD